MRIAVLHDDPLLPDMIRGALERHHHVCHFYTSGASLLKDTRHETFDLLISGWHLPDMDGMEVIQRLREMAGQQLPILLVTRRNEERDVIEALNRGADDYMVKPLRVGELAARVAALLRRAYPQAMGQQRFEARIAVLGQESIQPCRWQPIQRSALRAQRAIQHAMAQLHRILVL